MGRVQAASRWHRDSDCSQSLNACTRSTPLTAPRISTRLRNQTAALQFFGQVDSSGATTLYEYY
eukprot:415141-Rhodomonas_salina.2